MDMETKLRVCRERGITLAQYEAEVSAELAQDVPTETAPVAMPVDNRTPEQLREERVEAWKAIKQRHSPAYYKGQFTPVAVGWDVVIRTGRLSGRHAVVVSLTEDKVVVLYTGERTGIQEIVELHPTEVEGIRMWTPQETTNYELKRAGLTKTGNISRAGVR